MNYKSNKINRGSNNSQSIRESEYTSTLSHLNNSNSNSFKSSRSTLNNPSENVISRNSNSFKSAFPTLNNPPNSVSNHSTSKNNTNETDEKCKKKKWWSFNKSDCKRYNGKYRSKKWYGKRYENCEGLTKKECKSPKGKKNCDYKDYTKRCKLKTPPGTPQHNAAIEYKSGKFNDFEQFLINHQRVQEMIKAREKK